MVPNGRVRSDASAGEQFQCLAIDRRGGKTADFSDPITANAGSMMSKSVAAAGIVVLILVAVLWTIFPFDGPSEEGQPAPHAIDQSE
jgi:hypothetical protein